MTRDLSPPRTITVLHAISKAVQLFAAVVAIGVFSTLLAMDGCTPAPAHTEAVSHD